MATGVRNFIVLLLAWAVIFGAMPMAASAMTPVPAHGMAMKMAMPCGQHMPMPARDMPCDRQCCLCVLSGAALADGAVTIAPASLSMFQVAWPAEYRPEERARKPALPPPIA